MDNLNSELVKHSQRVKVTSIALVAFGAFGIYMSLIKMFDARRKAQMIFQSEGQEDITRDEFAYIDNIRIVCFIGLFAMVSVVAAGAKSLHALKIEKLQWKLSYAKRNYKCGFFRIAFLLCSALVCAHYYRDTKRIIKNHYKQKGHQGWLPAQWRQQSEYPEEERPEFPEAEHQEEEYPEEEHYERRQLKSFHQQYHKEKLGRPKRRGLKSYHQHYHNRTLGKPQYSKRMNRGRGLEQVDEGVEEPQREWKKERKERKHHRSEKGERKHHGEKRKHQEEGERKHHERGEGKHHEREGKHQREHGYDHHKRHCGGKRMMMGAFFILMITHQYLFKNYLHALEDVTNAKKEQTAPEIAPMIFAPNVIQHESRSVFENTGIQYNSIV